MSEAAKDPVPSRNRYHAVLLEALVRGRTVDEAAKAAGVCRKTVTRWKALHRGELDAARESLVTEALGELRAGLLSAARRLRVEAEDMSNGGNGIRAALGLLSSHHDLATVCDLQARIGLLEGRL